MAGGYKFPLEKLLEMRVDKEEESKRKFTESQKEKLEVENKLNSMQDEFERHKGIKPDEDVIYQKIKRRYLFALEAGIKNKQKELKIKERQLEIDRQDLKQKQIDRKTVSKLKENGYNKFIKEQNRIEQLNNDEFALYGYIRNLKGGENNG